MFSPPDFEANSRHAVAHHEMGHAVVTVLVDGTFTHVTIQPGRHGANGEIRSRGHVAGMNVATDFDRATIAMAGMFAAHPSDGHVNANGIAHDVHVVRQLGNSDWLDTDDPTTPAFRAKELVTQYRAIIDQLADRLVEENTLSFEEVRDSVNAFPD